MLLSRACCSLLLTAEICSMLCTSIAAAMYMWTDMLKCIKHSVPLDIQARRDEALERLRGFRAGRQCGGNSFRAEARTMLQHS